ncbi:MAG: hypothetical protein EXS14_09835 [Planctomycetes bacterium]|nr:hypothetical protein [Planctomycetota bacterium]
MLGPIVLQLAPFAVAAALLWLIATSSPLQRKALLAAWLLPGLGHILLGRRDRAMLFALTLIPTFVIGLVLGSFATVSPLDRHPIWGLAQIPGGLMTLITALTTQSVHIPAADTIYAVGSLYTGAACMLNILALCDVYDLAKPPVSPTQVQKP